MLGAMLVGAWLLIQQQCCVYGDAGRYKSAALVDPLMRRSPLEKNFMRFGRSSPATFSRDVRLKDNFMRFGRTRLDSLAGQEDFSEDRNPDTYYKQSEEETDVAGDKGKDALKAFKESGFSRLRKAKENFMRFGRSDKDLENDSAEDDKTKRTDNFMRFGRNRDETKESTTNADTDTPLIFSGEPDFLRTARAKENFMRFGRDKERVSRNEKGKQDSFIRFGKSEGTDDEDYDDCDEVTEKRRTRGGETGFVRFGRGKEKFIRFGKRKEETISVPPSDKDKTILIRVARDQDGIQRASRQKQGEKGNGFIRFGRSDRQKREVHKHKEGLRHLASTSGRNTHHEPIGACKLSFLQDKATSNKNPDCKDGSCKPLYLPWPFYYQPSIYSVLPNILATPQVSMIPAPQFNHKPKRSRANLQNFIRLG